MAVSGVIGALLNATLLCGFSFADSIGFPDWRTPETKSIFAQKPSATDTAPKETGQWFVSLDASDIYHRDTLISLDVRLHPLLSFVMWPIEWTAAKGGDILFQPLRDPVFYAERTDVIGRGAQVVRLDSVGNVMAYPTMVIDGGPGSQLGASLIAKDILGSGWNSRVSGGMMVNRDWAASTSWLSPLFTDAKLRWRGGYYTSKSSQVGVLVPDRFPMGTTNSPLVTAEQTKTFSTGLSIPLPWVGGIEPRWTGTIREVSEPANNVSAKSDLLKDSWFSNSDRGLRGQELYQSYGILWGMGHRDFEGTPSEGGDQSVAFERVSSHGGGDTWTLTMGGSRFFLLGDEKYVYRKGDVVPYLHMTPKTIIGMLDPQTLRKRLTQRRILAFNVRAVRMWEVDPVTDPASYSQYPSLGGAVPARAYSGGRLMGRSVIGGTAEYRWPIWRYIDGTMFTELAWAAPEWWTIESDRLAPGIGLGIRVRTRNDFFFRLQVATGREGTRFIATTSPEF